VYGIQKLASCSCFINLVENKHPEAVFADDSKNLINVRFVSHQIVIVHSLRNLDLIIIGWSGASERKSRPHLKAFSNEMAPKDPYF
jgi:hypothetical protein